MTSFVIFAALIGGFCVGYLISDVRNFNDVFNSKYVLKQKNLKSLDSLWYKVHSKYFFAKIGQPEQNPQNFTEEEIDILGVLWATFFKVPRVIKAVKENKNKEVSKDSIIVADAVAESLSYKPNVNDYNC